MSIVGGAPPALKSPPASMPSRSTFSPPPEHSTYHSQSRVRPRSGGSFSFHDPGIGQVSSAPVQPLNDLSAKSIKGDFTYKAQDQDMQFHLQEAALFLKEVRFAEPQRAEQPRTQSRRAKRVAINDIVQFPTAAPKENPSLTSPEPVAEVSEVHLYMEEKEAHPEEFVRVQLVELLPSTEPEPEPEPVPAPEQVPLVEEPAIESVMEVVPVPIIEEREVAPSLPIPPLSGDEFESEPLPYKESWNLKERDFARAHGGMATGVLEKYVNTLHAQHTARTLAYEHGIINNQVRADAQLGKMARRERREAISSGLDAHFWGATSGKSELE
ncbi:hypothetical protein HKX48_003512 [Thoreauomyces humboldtii]|nr:hypothetical protein HKX48_003512 [Thoreauomyces humboldtii]